MNERTLCIIPARGGSKRIPRKNIKLLDGKPLLSYAIESAIESNLFSTICISSEDEEILDVAREYPEVFPMKRDMNLASDIALIGDLSKSIIEEFESKGQSFENFCILLTTNPLRTAEDIINAHEILKNGDCDAVMSLVPFDHTPLTAVWAPTGKVKFFFEKQKRGNRQDMVELYRHDGAVYFSKTDTFLKNPVQYGENLAPYFIPVERSVDIDNPMDFEWAEFLINRNNQKESHENSDSH